MTTRLIVPALIATVLTLSGCSAAALTAPPETTPNADPITNCGLNVEYSNPQRIVTIKSSTTEMLLALGLEDRIVGTAFTDGPVPEQWADAADLPVISEKVPSQEAVL